MKFPASFMRLEDDSSSLAAQCCFI